MAEVAQTGLSFILSFFAVILVAAPFFSFSEAHEADRAAAKPRGQRETDDA